MKNLYAALEIGTTRTVLAIGESENGERLSMTCHAEIPSTGVRKSQILDISQATQSIRAVLQKVERLQSDAGAKITVGNAFLAVSGQHIRADPFFGSAQVGGARVGDDEINEVIRSARSMTLPKDRELLDIAEQDYVLDNLGGIASPKGMAGHVLKLNTLQIHADRNRIQDARTAADAAHLEIREPLFAATCAADAVLEDHERRNGALVIDLGGGSTGYAAYSDGYPAATGVIGVGGDHVTNDIAHAFQTTNMQAEGLKTIEANAMVGAGGDAPARVKVEQGDNTLMDTRTVSRHALNTVVNARLMELFTMIRENLEDADVIHRLHAGAVLTGGGASMKGIETLARQTLGMNVRTGRPIHIDGLEGEDFPAAYATIAGALLYAHRNYEEKSIFDIFFRRSGR
ncbi:MAG: cell division protein FtsA [Kiritimatiellae bacterium]|nr:cell division protein FtsA [Kiritimatiellia bacterium]